MRRPLLLAACAALVSGCVSVQGLPDPHGSLAPHQRIVVNVFPPPGPWIIGASDTKAEAAAKLSPLGFIVQTAENEHTLSVSKNLQQYLPRPHLSLAAQTALMSALRAARSVDTVQTGPEAGISELQLAEWNKSKDQLDWRQRYYTPDPDQPAPRDYAKILTLDDAIILDVNVSFGTDATDDGKLVPTMSASWRAYRGDTARLLWEHEDVVGDQVSSFTMTDIQVQPSLLTDSLQKLAPTLGTTIATSFLRTFTVMPSTSIPHLAAPPPGGAPKGLVDMSVFQNLSTATASVPISSATAPGVFASTPTVAAPTVSVSTPAVSVSTPSVSVSTSP